MIVAGRHLAPDRLGNRRSLGLPSNFFGFPLSSCEGHFLPKLLPLDRGQRPTDIGAPILPAEPVSPVLEATGGNAVQMQHVGSIALTAAPLDIAAM